MLKHELCGMAVAENLGESRGRIALKMLPCLHDACFVGVDEDGVAGLDNLHPFGLGPEYAYSLKQGIEDGFLAPFKVVRYRSSIDDGITVSKGESDIDTGDKFQKNTEYLLPDYGKDIQIKKHNEYVARTITDFLKNTIKDRYAKTIIFCETTQNAELLRSEINNLNTDITKNHPEYCMTARCGSLGKGAAVSRLFVM